MTCGLVAAQAKSAEAGPPACQLARRTIPVWGCSSIRVAIINATSSRTRTFATLRRATRQCNFTRPDSSRALGLSTSSTGNSRPRRRSLLLGHRRRLRRCICLRLRRLRLRLRLHRRYRRSRPVASSPGVKQRASRLAHAATGSLEAPLLLHLPCPGADGATVFRDAPS